MYTCMVYLDIHMYIYIYIYNVERYLLLLEAGEFRAARPSPTLQEEVATYVHMLNCIRM